MTIPDLETLSRLLDLLREKGVKSFRCAEIELELGTSADSTKPQDQKPECPCGHPLLEHSLDGCKRGCAIYSCEPTGEAR